MHVTWATSEQPVIVWFLFVWYFEISAAQTTFYTASLCLCSSEKYLYFFASGLHTRIKVLIHKFMFPLCSVCSKLEKILNSDEKLDTKWKYVTGEWFYEAKSRRHMDKIHGSEIILASMKQRNAPLGVSPRRVLFWKTRVLSWTFLRQSAVHKTQFSLFSVHCRGISQDRKIQGTQQSRLGRGCPIKTCSMFRCSAATGDQVFNNFLTKDLLNLCFHSLTLMCWFNAPLISGGGDNSPHSNADWSETP